MSHTHHSAKVFGPKVIAIDDKPRTNEVLHSCANHNLYWNIPAANTPLVRQIPNTAVAQFDRLACPMGAPTLLYGHCRRTDMWRLCRVFTCQGDPTFTIMWTDGTLQNRTKSGKDLFRPQAHYQVEEAFKQNQLQQESHSKIRDRVKSTEGPPGCVPFSDESNSHETVASVQGMSIWEAVRQGNLVNALYLIDREGVSPSAVCEEERHTPLYWAVIQDNVELVRELLERGANGEDAVKAAEVPSIPVKPKRRRRPFFPGTISRWKHQSLIPSPSERDDAKELIRAMLVAAQNDLVLPRRIYRHGHQIDCIVCCLRPATAIGLPCAHMACCRHCLEQSKRCPLCRAKVLAIAV